MKFVIDYNEQTGQMGLAGPLKNPILCLGLLELAKAAVLEQAHQKPEDEKRVLLATGDTAAINSQLRAKGD